MATLVTKRNRMEREALGRPHNESNHACGDTRDLVLGLIVKHSDENTDDSKFQCMESIMP